MGKISGIKISNSLSKIMREDLSPWLRVPKRLPIFSSNKTIKISEAGMKEGAEEAMGRDSMAPIIPSSGISRPSSSTAKLNNTAKEPSINSLRVQDKFIKRNLLAVNHSRPSINLKDNIKKEAIKEAMAEERELGTKEEGIRTLVRHHLTPMRCSTLQ